MREIPRDGMPSDRDRGRMSDRRGGYRRDEPLRNTAQDWRKRDPLQDSPRDLTK